MENKQPAWPRAVIFDMDGLMFKTEQQNWRAWDEVGPDYGKEPMGYNLLMVMGTNQAQKREYFRSKYGPDFCYDDFLAAYKARVKEIREREGIPMQEGLIELLDYLTEEEIPVLLATGSSRASTIDNLRMTGTAKYFPTILTGDMVERAKPDPFIYTKSCEILGLEPSETLVLEDSVNGVIAAYRAGTPVIMVPDLQKDMTEKVEGMYLRKMNSLLEVRDFLKNL